MIMVVTEDYTLSVQDVYRPIVYMVLDSLHSDHSKRAYHRALLDFFSWHTQLGRPKLSKAVIQNYQAQLLDSGLSPRTINQRMSAIRSLARELVDNELIGEQVLSGINRVKGIPVEGVRSGNWLTIEEVRSILGTPDLSTPKGVRDRAILSVMIGAGLRRTEVTVLEFKHLGLRDNRWIIVDLTGKRRRLRSIPIALWTKQAIDHWSDLANIHSGRVFRALSKSGRVLRNSLTPQTIYDIVEQYSTKSGIQFSPHDLRRTFAKLSHGGGAALEQIQLSLGHSSIKTTQDYLGLRQSLTQAPSDFIEIGDTNDRMEPDSSKAS